MRLANKVAVVTGAAGGLGEGISRCLAAAGAKVMLSDLQDEATNKLVLAMREDGFDVAMHRTDVTQRADTEALFDATISKFGQVDFLISNAGVDGLPSGDAPPAPLIENVTDDDWDAVMDVNLKGVFLTCRAFIPYFKERRAGRIINISSVAGRQGIEFLAPYAASKAAVISFTQSLALQLAPHRVNANTVCPGIIWTPMWERLANYLNNTTPTDQAGKPEEMFDSVVKQMIPFGAPQQAQDIGDSVVFLCAPESKEITGQALNVCGGIRMN